MLITILYVAVGLFVYFLGVGITKIILNSCKEFMEEDEKFFVCSLWPVFLFMYPLVTAFIFCSNKLPEIITGKKDEES